MLEPVQNCFTFYRPDGKAPAHIYDDQGEALDPTENTQQSMTNGAQQNLILPLSKPSLATRKN